MIEKKRRPSQGGATTSVALCNDSNTPDERNRQAIFDAGDQIRQRIAAGACLCGEPAEASWCPVCPPTCAAHRSPCLLCTPWNWLEPRTALPVRPHLQLKPVAGASQAIVILPLRFGWTDDDAHPWRSADVSAAFAAWLPTAGQG